MYNSKMIPPSGFLFFFMFCICDAQLQWTERDTLNFTFLDAVWTGKQLVAVGRAGAIATSPDGKSWTRQQSGLTSMTDITSITYTGKEFFAISKNILLRSIDGIHWNCNDIKIITQIANGNYSISKIVWNGNQLFIIGDIQACGIVLVSTDGIDWKWQPIQAKGADGVCAFSDVEWNGTCFVGVGIYRTFLHSYSDGLVWHTLQPDFPYGHLNSIVWTGKEFIVLGLECVMSSSDGFQWTLLSTLEGIVSFPSQQKQKPVWSGERLVVCYRNDTLLYSFSGKDWTKQCVKEASYLHGLTSSDKYIVLFGAKKNGSGVILTADKTTPIIQDAFLQNKKHSAFTYSYQTKRILFHLFDNSKICIRIFDYKGKIIANVIDKNLIPGSYDFSINSFPIASGSYIISYQNKSECIQKKITFFP